MCNQLCRAIKDQTFLPRIIVVVPYNDILMYIVGKNNTSSFTIGKVLHWLMSEFEKLIGIQKDYLPIKSKRDLLPHIVWIEAPYHAEFGSEQNRLWEKFNECMRNMAEMQKFTSVLTLKKIWNSTDGSYYSRPAKRLTVFGYKKFWEAVDCTIQYADTTIMKKNIADAHKKKHMSLNHPYQQTFHHTNQPNRNSSQSLIGDRFHWSSKNKKPQHQHRRSVYF